MVVYILDYLVFGGLMIGTGIIGFYFGFVKRSKSLSEYMTGKNNAVLPVLMSTIVTFTTPKQIIADPTAVVMFGTQTEFGLVLGVLLGAAIFMACFLPVHKNLRSRSLLRYFDLRHNKVVHTTAAIIMIINEVILLPALIYTPSMVVNEMLGVPTLYSAMTLTIICIFYTCMGGLKAVMWTDSLQYLFFTISVVVCICLGVYKTGGLSKVWQDGLDGERTEFINRGQPMYDRANVLGGMSTGTLYALIVGVTQQSFFQRINCLEDKSKTNSVVLTSYIGFFISRCNGLIAGLVIYSYFKGCHPLLTKEISNPDGIVPHFIRKMSETIPGVLGIFLAGLVSAALSTLSTSLNTMACLVHDDIVLTLFSRSIQEKTSFIIMKSAIVIVGIASFAVTPLYDEVKSLQQVYISVAGVTSGATLSLFAGIINPWVNNKGVIAGAFTGISVSAWLFYSQSQLKAQGKLSFASKLITTIGCNQSQFDGVVTNLTFSGYSGHGSRVFIDPDDSLAKFTAISYLWYSAISLGVSFVACTIVSLCTGVEDVSKLDQSLVCPQMRWLLLKKTSREKSEQSNDVTETMPLK